MTKRERKKLRRYIERETRCEIMARVGMVGFPEYAMYFDKAIRYRDKIRKLCFGTSDLVQLGHRFGLPIDPPRRPGKDKKHKDRNEETLFGR